MPDPIERTEPTATIDGIDTETIRDIGRSEEPPNRSAQPERTTENVSGFDVYSPADAISTAGTTPKRRGRPAGSRNRTSESAGTGTDSQTRAKAPGDITDLTKVLLSLHDMLAAVCQADYVEITKEQAAKLSSGIKEVGKHYSFNVTAKQTAVIDLVIIVLAIYGPMFVIMFKGISKPSKKDNLRTMPSPVEPVPQAAAASPQPVPAPKKGVTNPSEIWNETPSLDLTAI